MIPSASKSESAPHISVISRDSAPKIYGPYAPAYEAAHRFCNIIRNKIVNRRFHSITCLFKVFGVLCHLEHDCALYSFAEEVTAVVIYALDFTRGMICVCRTSAGAPELSPAIGALFSRIYIAASELVLDFCVGNAVPNITEQEFSSPTN